MLIETPKNYEKIVKDLLALEGAQESKMLASPLRGMDSSVVVLLRKAGKPHVHVIYNFLTGYRYNAVETEGIIQLGLPSTQPGKLLHYSEHQDLEKAAEYAAHLFQTPISMLN